MGRPDSDNLEVYRLAERLADGVWDMVSGWEPFARNRVGGQLFRTADSVGANIAEGAGRGTFQDNRGFVKIARGSLYEARHFLRRAVRRQLVTGEQVEKLRPILDELGHRLNAYLKSIGHRPRNAATGNGKLTTDQ